MAYGFNITIENFKMCKSDFFDTGDDFSRFSPHWESFTRSKMRKVTKKY